MLDDSMLCAQPRDEWPQIRDPDFGVHTLFFLYPVILVQVQRLERLDGLDGLDGLNGLNGHVQVDVEKV
jgi:hypothetical protein